MNSISLIAPLIPSNRDAQDHTEATGLHLGSQHAACRAGDRSVYIANRTIDHRHNGIHDHPIDEEFVKEISGLRRILQALLRTAPRLLRMTEYKTTTAPQKRLLTST